jgi:hypothetical protein
MPIMDYYSEIGCRDLKSNTTENRKQLETSGEEEKTGKADSKFSHGCHMKGQRQSKRERKKHAGFQPLVGPH